MVSVGMLLLLVCLVVGLYPLEGKFDPYVDNGGTVVGLAGRDYVMFASDTRLSDQYMIRSRRVSRVFEIEEGLLFSGSGCWADVVALSKELQAHARKYEWEHEKKLSIRPLSYLMSSELYSKRFFPYFTFCMVAGLDKEGTGAVYRYDAVGSSERVAAVCSGKGEHLIQPILDEITHMEEDDSLWELSNEGENAFLSGAPGAQDPIPGIPLREKSIGDIATGMSKAGRSTGVAMSRRRCVDLNEKDACDLVVRAFRAAAEREISIGDGVEVWVVRKKSRMDELIDGKSGGRTSNSNARLLKRLYFSLPAH